MTADRQTVQSYLDILCETVITLQCSKIRLHLERERTMITCCHLKVVNEKNHELFIWELLVLYLK